jgi:hypothetical protein
MAQRDLAKAARLPSIEVARERRAMLDKLFSRFSLGFGLGYVVGARAGRERYEEIVGWWNSFVGNPNIRQVAQRGRELVTEAGEQVVDRIQQIQRPSQDIREVMTATPETIGMTSTVKEAATKMKQQEAGAMVVVDEFKKVVGILTDRDIAIRAVAEGRDAKSTKVGDIASMVI